MSALPTPIQEELRQRIGWTFKKEELLQQTGVFDDWLVLYKEEYMEERLLVEQFYLFGRHTQKYARLIQFSLPGQPRQWNLIPNSVLTGELVFYPSSLQERVLIKHIDKVAPLIQQEVNGFASFQAVEHHISNSLVSFPVLARIPLILNEVTPHILIGNLVLIDQGLKVIPIQDKLNQHLKWELLAMSGGEPLSLFGFFEHQTFHPLGAWINGNYHIIE